MDSDDFPPWPLAWHPRVSGDKPDPDRFVTPRCDGDAFRTSGGLWTSPMLGQRHSGWSIRHDRDELSAHHVRQGWAMRWPDRARTAIVDSLPDLCALTERFGCREHRDMEELLAGWLAGWVPDRAQRLGLHNARYTPPLDFAAMAQHFDALWLTEKGRQATLDTRPGTAMWDVETVLWLAPAWQLLHPITTVAFDEEGFLDDLYEAVRALSPPA